MTDPCFEVTNNIHGKPLGDRFTYGLLRVVMHPAGTYNVTIQFGDADPTSSIITDREETLTVSRCQLDNLLDVMDQVRRLPVERVAKVAGVARTAFMVGHRLVGPHCKGRPTEVQPYLVVAFIKRNAYMTVDDAEDFSSRVRRALEAYDASLPAPDAFMVAAPVSDVFAFGQVSVGYGRDGYYVAVEAGDRDRRQMQCVAPPPGLVRMRTPDFLREVLLVLARVAEKPGTGASVGGVRVAHHVAAPVSRGVPLPEAMYVCVTAEHATAYLLPKDVAPFVESVRSVFK